MGRHGKEAKNKQIIKECGDRRAQPLSIAAIIIKI